MLRNFRYLQNHSMPQRYIERCLEILRANPIVSEVYDVKAVAIGPDTYRFKAEILPDSNAISRLCMDSMNLDFEAQRIDGDKQMLVRCLFEFGDAYVRALGDQIDVIEKKIREEMPEIKYVDLETI